MSLISHLVDDGDICGLLFLILLLCGIGGKMIEPYDALRVWGIRIATAIFILTALARVLESQNDTPLELAGVVLSSLAAAGLVLGPTWIVFAVVGFAYSGYRRLVDIQKSALQARRRNANWQEAETRRQHEQTERERRARAEADVARQEAQRQLIQATHRNAESQQREDACFACELFYNFREPDVKERFSREQFANFVSKYMNDDKPVDVVQRRAKELQMLIQQHYEAVKPPERFSSLAELTQWYKEQKSEIEQLPVADLYRNDFLVRLNEQYSELSDRLMEAMGP